MRVDEKTAAEDFAQLVLGVPASAVEGRRPPDPDAWVHSPAGVVGLEVTSAYDEDERRTLEHESDFLKELEREVASNTPPPRMRFLLNMQDDSDEVIHQATEETLSYPALARWLDGLIVQLYEDAAPQPIVALNQAGSQRRAKGLFPRKKDLQLLARELASYARSLRDDSFQALPFPGHPRLHLVTTARRTGLRQPEERSGWNLPSLTKKLTNPEKYSTSGLVAFHLLIHNHVPDFDRALRVWHAYWHHRDAILRHLTARAKDRSTPLFQDVFFLDYSDRLGGVEVYRIGDGNVVRVAGRV